MTEQELEIHFARQRDQMRLLVREEIDIRIKPLEITIGQIDNTGRGGTGLAGQIARTNSQVNQLFRLRDIGMGVFVAVSLTGAVLLAGVKSWVQGVMGH